jgi:hypothetical protein
MSKRYINTDRWKNRNFLQLSVYAKIFYIYVWDNCDHAGIWDINFDLAEYQLNYKFNRSEIETELFEMIVIVGKKSKWFIPGFIEVNYNNTLKPNVKCQKSVLEILNTYSELKSYVDDYSFSQDLPYEE